MKIDYKKLTDKALLTGVVVPLLQNQLLHRTTQIYITFSTQMCNLNQALKTMFKEKLTLSLENYTNLVVGDDSFTITTTLHTGSNTITVPFAAIMQFIDKTNEFALEFEPNMPKNTSSTNHETDKIIRFNNAS